RTRDAPEARPSLLLLTKTQRTTTFSAPNPARAQQSPEAGTALGTWILYEIFIFVWGGQPLTSAFTARGTHDATPRSRSTGCARRPAPNRLPATGGRVRPVRASP